MSSEIIDAETGELVPYQAPQPVSLFGTNDPTEVVEAAKRAATPLVDVIRSQKLAVKIGPSEHVRVEGWTLLGSMLGVFPICVWTRQLEREGVPIGWEARVEARTRSGETVGAAEAQCTRDENQWSWEPTGKDGRKLPPRDDYALRSMAQTRATSKALRQPLGFVMQLAGFNPTPAEEMPTPDRKPREKKDKAQQMRARILELVTQADEKRGEALTLDEIEHAFTREWQTSLADADQGQLEVLGKELNQWVETGCVGSFSLVPF